MTERDRGYDKEVHRSNAVLVVVEKSHPALLLPFVAGLSWHFPRNVRKADRETELAEFCMNLPSAPAIVQGECLDEGLNLS